MYCCDLEQPYGQVTGEIHSFSMSKQVKSISAHETNFCSSTKIWQSHNHHHHQDITIRNTHQGVSNQTVKAQREVDKKKKKHLSQRGWNGGLSPINSILCRCSLWSWARAGSITAPGGGGKKPGCGTAA